MIARKLEVRPPGRGEASAFERRQELIGRLSIQFDHEDEKEDTTWISAFRSHTHGYSVYQTVHWSMRSIAGGRMWVERKNLTKVSMEEFIKERAKWPIVS
jgi:hypothetical protein